MGAAMDRKAPDREDTPRERDERLAAVRELARMGLPVGTPQEMKAESVELPGDLP